MDSAADVVLQKGRTLFSASTTHARGRFVTPVLAYPLEATRAISPLFCARTTAELVPLAAASILNLCSCFVSLPGTTAPYRLESRTIYPNYPARNPPTLNAALQSMQLMHVALRLSPLLDAMPGKTLIPTIRRQPFLKLLLLAHLVSLHP